jgi:hypothetical protein
MGIVNHFPPPFLKSNPRKSCFLFMWICFLFFSGMFSSNAEDVEIGRRITEIEHKVIRLTVPFKQSNRQVMAKFFWENAGRHYVSGRWLPLREGRHAYEIRTHSDLKSSVPFVMLALDEGMKSAGLEGEIVQPSLGDELDIFLKPQQVLPYTAQGLEEHALFGMTWNNWIGFLFAASLILFCFFLRKSFFIALFLAFWIAWGAVDLRAMFDHLGIIRTTQKDGYWMDAAFSQIQADLQKPLDEMGDKTWALDESWDTEYPIYKPIINYMFAEKKFIPHEREKDADFLFSIKNGDLRVRSKP